MFREISLPNILLRGHGCTRPSHPRPPSPRGAAGPRNRGLRGLPRAAVCLGSRSPRPSHRQNPTERRGEKFSENLGASKVEVLEIVATQKSSLNLRNIVVLKMFSGCFYDIELVEKTVACGVLSKPCQPCLQSRCTWINSNILQLYQTNLPMIGTPHHLKIIARFCSFVPGISFNWLNKQGQENETSV